MDIEQLIADVRRDWAGDAPNACHDCDTLCDEVDRLAAIVAKLPKTDDGVPMMPGERYFASCRDRWDDDEDSWRVLEVIWWKGGGDDCFNPAFTFADESRDMPDWEFFDVEGVCSTRAAAEQAQSAERERAQAAPDP